MRRALLALICCAACGGASSGDNATDGSVAADASGDAVTSGDAGTDTATGGSRCTVQGTTLVCSSHTMQIGGRTVTYEVPLGAPPAAGWPAVVYYQGSFVPGSQAFAAAPNAVFGQYELTSTVKALLDDGYAVIAPNAQANGSQYWQTNIPPYSTSWANSDDDVFVRALLAAMANGTFGSLDGSRRYAMGISSGGFMTSRMAVSYAGTFRALVIASGSYATCSNTCSVPALPADHPPTLFIHGATDPVVPVGTMTAYRDKLLADGRVASAVIVPDMGHQWLAAAVTAVPAWFDAH